MDRKSLAFVVAFLYLLADTNSEGNRKVAERFQDYSVSRDALEIDADKVGQLWMNCRKEPHDIKEHVKPLTSNLCQPTHNGHDRRSSQSTISDLPQTKQELKISNCLSFRKFPATRNEHHALHTPRRYLRSKSEKLQVLASSSPVHLASSPIHLSPFPSPSSSSGAPVASPVKPKSPPPPGRSYPSLLPNIVSPGFFQTDDDNNKKYVIASVAASSVAGLLLFALLLFCCLKKSNKIEPKVGRRDEKPLLNFSGSSVSAGSSQKSNGIGNLSCNSLRAPSKMRVESLNATSNDHTQNETEMESLAKNSTLPLPPGRTPTETTKPPPPPPPKPPAPAPPPPPPKVSRAPPRNPPLPTGSHRRSSTGDLSVESDGSEAPKAKLKPFFWDKVLANPDHSMVWHDIKAGSFQFNEEMMENLFGYVPNDKNKTENRKDSSSSESVAQFIQIIDSKKAQNIAILLKALNVTTEEVCDSLREGNQLPTELVETLLKMAPTTDEELKLRLYGGDVSHLGPAERFLKIVLEIPFAFKRLESLLFVSTFQEEVSSIKESFTTIEVACKKLRNSRLFLKLLEAVLKTGNRMNDGTYRGGAQAFKLDTLLKLSDVKGTDGKTTLLHFVIQEIIRSEGVRAARKLRESPSMSSVKTEDLIDESSHETGDYHRSLGLQVVSGLGNELENVRKAALIDKEILTQSVSTLGLSLGKTLEFLETDMKDVGEEAGEYCEAMMNFIRESESEVKWLIEEEKRIMALAKSTGDYFHGKAGKDEGLRIFMIVRDFLLMLDKVCKDVKSTVKLPANKVAKKDKELSPSTVASPSKELAHESPLDIHLRLFPAMRARQIDDDDDFSSDDE